MIWRSGALVLAIFLLHVDCGKKQPSPLDDLPSIDDLPVVWSTQNGEKKTLRDGNDKIRIQAFFFTSCPAVCPRLVEDLKGLESQIPPMDRNKVRFVLVSTDPERDTPEKLRAYMTERGLAPERWTLLVGSPSDAPALAAILRLGLSGSGDDMIHATIASVIDRKGKTRYRANPSEDNRAAFLKAVREAD